MFETNIAKDLEGIESKAELESIAKKIFNKYREEFIAFIEELKNKGIAQSLFNSSTPEETIAIWEKFSSENQELFERIKSWAENRDAYFYDRDHMPLFEDDEEPDCVLEIGLMFIIVKDDILLDSEDIHQDYNQFCNRLVEVLTSSPNRLIKAAGYFLDCDDMENITAENIYKFCPED